MSVMPTSAVSTPVSAAAPPRQTRGTGAFDAEVEERLVRYARIDTQSDESSTMSPSTRKQFNPLEPLADRAVGRATSAERSEASGLVRLIRLMTARHS